MADPQQALFLASPDDLPAGDWSRLYFGAEFCPWRFPSTEQLIRSVDFSHQSGLPVTIATPVLNETFLPRFKRQMKDLLPCLSAEDELLVSDLGAIRLVRELSATVSIIAGRVLSGQKRGPRIVDLDLKMSELEYFRQSRWHQSGAAEFLVEHGIRRVELDNLLQGVAPLPGPLVASLHLPYAMVTSSRNCPVRAPGDYGPCPGGCGDAFRLTTPQSDIPLYQAGNTQFLMNPLPPDDLVSLNVDRIVTHRSLPA